MSEANDLNTFRHDAYVGTSREELAAMCDSELAQWQTNHKDELPLFTLAEREWQRRIISHQLKEQFKLDSKLAEAAERANKFTMVCIVVATIVGAIIGGTATVIGAKMQQPQTPNISMQPETTTPTKQPGVFVSPPASEQFKKKTP